MGKHKSFRSPHAYKYTPELFEHICKRISTGMKVLKACEKPLQMKGSDLVQQVNQNTFHTWIRKDINDCAKLYAATLLLKTDAVFDIMFDIADDVKADAADIAKAKVRIDVRKWYLQKVDPSKFSDKTVTEHTGKDGGPIQISNMTDKELEEKIKLLSK